MPPFNPEKCPLSLASALFDMDDDTFRRQYVRSGRVHADSQGYMDGRRVLDLYDQTPSRIRARADADHYRKQNLETLEEMVRVMKQKHQADPVLARVADEVRRTPTGAQSRLLAELLALPSGSGWQFQVVLSHWIASFYHPRYELTLEADGPGHSSKNQIQRDAAHDSGLWLMGIRVLRFVDKRILEDMEGVLAEIRAASVVTPRYRAKEILKPAYWEK